MDCVTCDPVDAAPRMAENNILFLMSSSPDLIGQAQEINPEAKYGMAPIPALNDSYEPAFCGGEREAYGIWKDTENEALCLALLDYMAKPENVKIVCEASGKRPAIQNVSPDLGSVAEDYATYADTAIYPFFDRVYPVSYTHLDVYKRQVQGFGQAQGLGLRHPKAVVLHAEKEKGIVQEAGDEDVDLLLFLESVFDGIFDNGL